MDNDPIFTGIRLSRDSLPLDTWTQVGFRFGDRGTHTSRTMMLQELTLLFQECKAKASREEYFKAVVEDNCLGKSTTATRKISFQRLSELYALDASVPLFRILRFLWGAGGEGRPLLALLTALARDPLLRVTATPILAMRPGEELARQQMTDALHDRVGDRLNDNILDKVVRNAASSWTQSGHLRGRGRKVRQTVSPTPVVTVYALLLGYMLGVRSAGLYHTFWARVLDASEEELRQLTMEARRLGLLDISQAGGVVEVSFSGILTEEERRLIHGQN